jgi:6-phosphogluconolactonase
MAAVTLAADERALAQRAAERITSLVEQSVAARGSATVCLTGGSTPRHLYSLLADRQHPWRERMPWGAVHLFWGDERHVPPDHTDSNYGMAAQAMIRHVPVPDAQVHRMRGEIADARDAARTYARELATAFTRAGRADRTFDVMLLGLGEDAHIASIFPGSELLDRRSTDGRAAGDRGPGHAGRVAVPTAGAAGPRLGATPAGDGGTRALADDDRVAAVWAAHLDAWRITLTPDALLDARSIVVIVAGDKKADAVHAAIEEALDVRRWPAQLLREADDRVEWMIDRAAAARLQAGGTRAGTEP